MSSLLSPPPWGGGGVRVFLTTMPCQPHTWVSHAGSPAGSMAMGTMGESDTGLAMARQGKCCAKRSLQVLAAEPRATQQHKHSQQCCPCRGSQAFYKDTNGPPEAIGPETAVGPWSLSHLAGQAWLHLLDKWPTKPLFEPTYYSYTPISVEVFKHLLQLLNIYFILPLGWKNRLEERAWERRSMRNMSMT